MTTVGASSGPDRGGDPFGTAGIRERVLAAWAASPARFREDANAEEDLVHGAYRDRLLVELAQNAADAAARAGIPGELRLSLVDGELRAANTGAPLDHAGVEALATLRASAKRDGGSVGRFGVGFAAVLTVTDAPLAVSGTGGVRFSAADTLSAVQAIPALAGELDRRGGRVPVLRLPWPADALPPAGYDTEVRLPLRSGTGPVVRAALAELDPALLLALPALRVIDADGRVLSRQDGTDGTVLLSEGNEATRWRVGSRSGRLPPDLLAGRPLEEQHRPEWTVQWAVPVDPASVPVPPARRPVVHAPTPTDEPLSLPALLLGTFPLASDRRHVTPGPVTDLLVEQAGAAYAELVAALPADPALLALVPRPTLAAAELDAALNRAVLAALRATLWLPAAVPPIARSASAGPTSAVATGDSVASPVGEMVAAGAPARRMAPGDAVVVDGASDALVAVLGDLVSGLLPSSWSGRGQAAALRALGVGRLSTSDVVGLVSGVDRPPGWWRELYAALADEPDREALAALPVPLADGRTVTGVRGVLLPDADLPAAAASALGLRVVEPAAAHPMLERLGAVPATARGVLADDRVRAAVEASYDEEDPAPIADAVLALVAGARPEPGELPWLAELALPGDDGDWYPAGELLLPGSALAEVVDPDAPFGTVAAEVVDRWGADVLRAVGALTTFALLHAEDVELDPDGAGHDLDGETDWIEAMLDRLPQQPAPPRVAELVAVRDLDLVRADAWDSALPMVAALAGVGRPVVAVLPGGGAIEVPSYTTWWLSTHRTLRGRRPDRLRSPAATDLAGLYDLAEADPALLAVAGCLRGLDDALADRERALDLLRRLGDPTRTVPGPTHGVAYARLAVVLEDSVEPPERVRTAPDRTVAREVAVVLDAPHLLPLLAGRVPVPAGGSPGPVADLLDLPLATELVGRSTPGSTPIRHVAWSDIPGAALAAERCGAAEPPPATVAVHSGLAVGDTAVPWWPDGATDHVDGDAGSAALGRALAWRLGAWNRRAAATEALADPDAADRLRAEDAAG